MSAQNEDGVFLPFVAEAIGDEAVAECIVERGGQMLVIRYHPGILLRTARIARRSREEQQTWITAAIAAVVVDGQTRYAGEGKVLERLLGGLEDELGGHCGAWVDAFLRDNPRHVARAKARYEARRGGA